jgi:hypothetical protein
MEKNHKKIIAVIICIVVLIIGVYLLIKQMNKDKSKAAMIPDAPPSGPAPEFKADTSKSVPVRNNNPFNLKLTKLNWNGKVPNEQNTDGKFEQFYEKKYGIRAGLKNIINKVAKGKNTLSILIPIYAPSTDDNNTNEYIQQVSSWTGFDPFTPIGTDKDSIIKLAGAITRKEGDPIDTNQLEEGYNLI